MDRLDNPVRHYAWGSASDIPEFLGTAADGTPQAEVWMGAHPGDSSRVVRGGASRSLREVIAADTGAELGPAVAAQYGGRLPFLLKVLSAGQPLSLQVHPDKARAADRFGDPRYADDYADDNHKPELICALRDGFEALCGFRPVPGTIALLDALAVPAMASYRERLERQPGTDGVRAVVTGILTGADGGVEAGSLGGSEAGSLAETIAAVGRAGQRVADGGGEWAAAAGACARLAAGYPRDPGVLVALLLNYAVLAEGEALFVAAGVPHCYLRGFGTEAMAASDNVLRAGLTGKRVNVPELLEVLDFTPAPLHVLHPSRDGVEETYPVPVPDFRLGRVSLGAGPVPLPSGGPQILLCIAGTARLRAPGGGELELARGGSAYLAASCAGVTAAGPGTLLRATVGS
ncbi:MAG TPA: mannose-6-phosphate isomerase, class I [Streptosporangiaceae bacterium]|nr:mannose-6-phosphate isomerase, class I [Streptosporangiaceae bacterium]